MYRVWGRLALVLLLPISAAAQSASTDERDQAMQEMRARIEKLEKLVAELQKDKESRSTVATAQPAAETTPENSVNSSTIWKGRGASAAPKKLLVNPSFASM